MANSSGDAEVMVESLVSLMSLWGELSTTVISSESCWHVKKFLSSITRRHIQLSIQSAAHFTLESFTPQSQIIHPKILRQQKENDSGIPSIVPHPAPRHVPFVGFQHRTVNAFPFYVFFSSSAYHTRAQSLRRLDVDKYDSGDGYSLSRAYIKA